MAINIGKMSDMIALFCKGVDPVLSENHELIRDIINIKLKELTGKTGALESTATLSSVASQKEYELPADNVHVKFVFYDDAEAYKLTHKEALELEQANS